MMSFEFVTGIGCWDSISKRVHLGVFFFIRLIIPSFSEADNFLDFFTHVLPQSRGDGLKIEPLTHLSV